MGEEVHLGIECDECQMCPIQGPRYKCLECPDYDLCEECYNKDLQEHKMEKQTMKGRDQKYLDNKPLFAKN